MRRAKEISIIGYSLRLPNSDSPFEFHENLFNKINMVTKDERRWRPGYEGTPKYFGKLKQSLDYFDNIFFSIHGKQAEKLDAQIRLLLETSFEALIDAAVFLEEIKGSSTGVYIGTSFSDIYRLLLTNRENITGYENTGCAASMCANRLSYFYDLHGPSFITDSACASSLTALNCALTDLHTGKCDLAIVGGSSLLLDSSVTIAFNKLKMLSPDGFCKTFDTSANGYTRAEGITVLILTSNPKYVRYLPHAKILAAANNTCGYQEKGISYPSRFWQTELYKKLIKQTKISPSDVKYIECHGTGTVAGDTEEVAGIKNFFGDRTDLVLGAVKACIGHVESASGLAGIAKVLLSYETKTLYPQLHLNERIPELNQLKIPTEATPWIGGKAVINSFGFGGANASVLIENETSKKHVIQKKWHALYFISSRTKEGLYQLKRELEKAPQQLPVWINSKYPWRETVGIADDPQIEEVIARPIYFMFSGNGSQWQGMGIELMKTSTLFKEVLTLCGKDIPTLLRKGWTGPLNATRLLTAIQIGLFELLKSFGIKADGYIGYSAGEIAASYATGATTIKETMAIATARGKAAEKMPKGLMISVGLSPEAIQPYIQQADQVSIACINSPENITLSGNQKQIKKIMEQLQKDEIFVRELNTEEKPYHSLLIDEELIVTQLANVFKGSVKRNPAWISAIDNYHPNRFTKDYHIQSVLRQVNFLDAMRKVPEHAIAIEIGPHAMLRALIRDCTTSIKYVPLMIKETHDLETFKQGIGRLWMLGANLNIIPDLVRPPLFIRAKQVAWQRELFPLPRDNDKEKNYKRTFTFDLKGKDAYLLAHKIEDRPIFPGAGYIYIMWQSYLRNHPKCKIVTIDNLQILRSVPLIGDKITLEVLSPISGEYEINFNNELIAKAKLSDKETAPSMPSAPIINQEDILTSQAFYRYCHNQGIEYGKDFQVIEQAFVPDHHNVFFAQIKFKEWISYLDGLLQLSIMSKQVKGLSLPTSIRHIELSKKKDKFVISNTFTDITQCGEILIQGIQTTSVNRRHREESTRFLNEDFLKIGRNIITDAKGDYQNAILAYSIKKFKSIQDKLTEPHHEKIKTILKNYSSDVNIKLANYPNAHYYKLLDDVYDQVEHFLQNPISTIAQSRHYADIYHNDYAYNIKFLEKCISVVRENSHPIINIFEIGTGTGGFLKQVGHCLHPQDYITGSDIIGNSIIHNKVTQLLNINYSHFDLNKPMTSDIKHLIKKADLIVASNALHISNNIKNTLQNLHVEMKPGAFMLLIETTSPVSLPLFGLDKSTWNFEDEREFGLWLSNERWQALFKGVDFKLISYETNKNSIITVYLIRKPLPKRYNILPAPTLHYDDHWANQIKNSSDSLIFYDKFPGGMFGFSRTLTREGKLALSFCAPDPDKFINKVKEYGLVTNLEKNNELYTLCYTSQPEKTIIEDQPCHIEFYETGHFDHFRFVKNKPHKGKLCKVEYAALNFRDVMLASGKIKKESCLGYSKESSCIGIEFSGYSANKPVMGIGLDTIANYVNTDFIWDVPEHIDLASAATIPVAYLTAYYALYERANIQNNTKILIHAGSGAVGQAAIRVAYDAGCEVFTTCHTSKREYLKKLFPTLDDAHIADSRSTQFEQQIMEMTQGQGVDIILNSLADDKLQAGLHCLAQNGIFIEIGKSDIMRNTPIGMQSLLPNTTICGVDVDQIFNNKKIMKKVSTLFLNGLKSGVVKPLDHTLFTHAQLPEALRFLGSGKHLGKVLIDMRAPISSPIENRFYTSGTHLIIGGLGGFGMALAEWLAARGAEHLILVSRKGIVNGEQKLFLRRLQKANIKIDIIAKDITQFIDAKNLIENCPPLTGIYHLALVLHDTLFEGMTKDKWEETVNAKAKIAKHLDKLTRKKSINQFVCFSSMATHGNAGQSNYAFANNYMESICYSRHQAGYPALAIQWGSIGNVGFVANQDSKLALKLIQNLGIEPQSIHSCLAHLEMCLLTNNVVCQVFSPYQEKATKLTNEKINIIEKINQILNIDLRKMPGNSNLIALGMDSLQTAEIQSILSQVTQENTPINELSKMTIAELIAKFNPYSYRNKSGKT